MGLYWDGRQKGEGEGPGEGASRSSGHMHSVCAGRRGMDPEQKVRMGVVAGIRIAWVGRGGLRVLNPGSGFRLNAVGKMEVLGCFM